MTIKVQIQPPEQETPYLPTAKSWESPEGKDHLIYPAYCNIFFKHLLVFGRAGVAGQTDIYSDLEKTVTFLSHDECWTSLFHSVNNESGFCALFGFKKAFQHPSPQDGLVSVMVFIHAKSKIHCCKWLKKKQNLLGSKGHGNRDEFWTSGFSKLGTMALGCCLLTAAGSIKVCTSTLVWLFSVTAPVNCPVRYYLLNIYCLFPVHVWWG